MADVSTLFGGPPPPTPQTFNPIAGDTFPVGTPVTGSLTDDIIIPAFVTTDPGHFEFVIGFASSPGLLGHPVNIRFLGPLTLTTQEWDLITGDTGGLLPGLYFLDQNLPGRIVNAAVSGTIFVVGRALSRTTMFIQPVPFSH